MRTYVLTDERGQKVTVEENKLFGHVKLILAPVLSEMGMMPETIAKYDGDLYALIGVMIAYVRDKESSLAIARREFKKLRDQRDADYALILNFIRAHHHMMPQTTENVVDLHERKAA